MSPKVSSSTIKVLKANPGIMVATLVVGAALATAGWWYSDRLNLAGFIGETPSINEEGTGGANCTKDIEIIIVQENGKKAKQHLKCDMKGATGYRLKWIQNKSGGYQLVNIYDAKVLNSPKYIIDGPLQETGEIDLKQKAKYDREQFEKNKTQIFEDSIKRQYDGGR